MDCVKRIKISFVNVGTYSSEENFIGPIPYMPLENILISCMPLAPHVIDTKKYTYMPLSGTQGMSIKSDGIPGIFSNLYIYICLIWKTMSSNLLSVHPNICKLKCYQKRSICNLAYYPPCII
jgi:hypothetical protein